VHWDEIQHVLEESLHTGAAVALRLYDQRPDYELTGVVQAIDERLRRIKLECRDEIVWLPFGDVLAAELAE
jgi:hypothetical protein